MVLPVAKSPFEDLADEYHFCASARVSGVRSIALIVGDKNQLFDIARND